MNTRTVSYASCIACLCRFTAYNNRKHLENCWCPVLLFASGKLLMPSVVVCSSPETLWGSPNAGWDVCVCSRFPHIWTYCRSCKVQWYTPLRQLYSDYRHFKNGDGHNLCFKNCISLLSAVICHDLQCFMFPSAAVSCCAWGCVAPLFCYMFGQFCILSRTEVECMRLARR